MANSIILKRSSTPNKVPTTAQLDLGEIAINTFDGKVFIKKDDGSPAIMEIGAVQSVNGASGVVVLDTDDFLEGTNQYFTTARARAAVSAGIGIAYNSATGVISASQNIATSASPTFAGLTLNGNVTITGNIVPTADITYDLGSPTMQWKDIYVGPGSLYVNGSKVLQDDTGTITFSADQDQNIRIKTTGNGILQLGTSTTTLQIDSTLQMTAGKRITSSDGVKVQFGDDVEMNNNKVIGLGAPTVTTDAATKGYVDTSIAAISTSSIQQGDSSVSVVDSGTGTVTVTVDGSTALTVTSSGVVIAGNMTVNGTTTTVNSNTIALADNIITLNSDATGTPTQNAGIEVERGDEANVLVRWNEGLSKWQFTNDGATYFPVASSTTDLAEGTNEYFTTARARSAVSASTSTGVAYNSTSGLISLGSIPNSSLSNNSITINGASVALGGTRTLNTGDFAESGNLFFTDARARAAVSATGDLSYNSSTGAFSFTKPSPVVTVTMTGDVTGSASATLTSLASGTVSIATTIAANSVALGTDTTGNYVAGVSAGTGISVSGSGSEGATVTVAHSDTSSVASLTALTGANVVSDIDFDDFGHVTAIATRAMTLADLGYTGATNANYITNNNQLTNGAGYVTSSGVTAVTATGPVVSSGGTTPVISMAAATSTVNGYMTSTYAAKLDGIAAGATTNTGTVTSVATGNGLTGGTITTTGTLSLSGSYTGTWAVTGGITATGEVTAYYSDKNLKKDIVEITDPIAKVMSLRGVTFRPNQTALDLGIIDKEEVGVIAQEVEAVLPQLVTPSAFEGYKTVKYDKLTALLLEAVKAQQLQIDALRAEISKLGGGSARNEL